MWWKIYFWLYLILTVVGLFYVFGGLSWKDAKFIDLYGFVFSILSALAVYSYVFKRIVLSSKFWRVLLWFLVVATLAIWILSITPIQSQLSDLLTGRLTQTSGSFLGEMFGIIVGLPSYYAIYKLGYGKFAK